MSYLDKVKVVNTTYDIQDSKAQADIAALDGRADDLEDAVFDRQTNVLDPGEITNGKYVNSEGGLSGSSTSAYTDYMAVTPGAVMTLSGVSLNTLRSVVAYSTDVAGNRQTQRLDNGTEATTFTCTIPSWAHYVRATTLKDGTVTGSETVTDDKVADLGAEVKSLAENKANRNDMTRFVAELENPLEMAGLTDIKVYATPLGYKVNVKPGDFVATGSGTVYVDAENGDDTADGTEEAPLQTLAEATGKAANTIMLKAGTYTAPETAINKNINIIGMEDGVIISGGCPFTGDIEIYLENITFDGGGNACSLVVGSSEETPVFCAYKCVFKNATSSNGLTIKGEVSVRIFDCQAIDNKKDGFNYHKNTTISPKSGAPNVLEVNCIGNDNGTADDEQGSCNGSTAHNGSRIIRVNGEYYRNHGGNVADNGRTLTWNINCRAGYSAETPGDINNADYWANSEAEMYCDSCTAEGSPTDAWAKLTSTIHVAGGGISTILKDSDSSLATYTSTAALVYLAD